jgi:DNA-binding NtrC family response regulator
MPINQTANTFIVDDDPFWTSMLSQVLTDLGFTSIQTFSNGKDCLDNLDQQPNYVFLDYNMEDMDGIEVLQQLKKNLPDVGVVFCTAQEDLRVAVSAIQYGSFEYLLKTNVSKKEVGMILQRSIQA